MTGPEDSTARGVQEVLPLQEPVDKLTTPSEARVELPGPRRALLKVSLLTRIALEEPSGKKHRHCDCSKEAEKHLALIPWNPESETYKKEAPSLLWWQKDNMRTTVQLAYSIKHLGKRGSLSEKDLVWTVQLVH